MAASHTLQRENYELWLPLRQQHWCCTAMYYMSAQSAHVSKAVMTPHIRGQFSVVSIERPFFGTIEANTLIVWQVCVSDALQIWKQSKIHGCVKWQLYDSDWDCHQSFEAQKRLWNLCSFTIVGPIMIGETLHSNSRTYHPNYLPTAPTRNWLPSAALRVTHATECTELYQ